MIAFAPPLDEAAVRDYLDRTVTLPPEVERILIEVGNDWMGDPAVFFWVIVHDDMAQNFALLTQIQRSVDAAIFQSGLNLQPYT